MNRTYRSLARSIRDERGQIIPWLAFMGALFIGVGGLSVDLGRAYVCYDQLKASTNAAAMAGAYAMIQSGATTTTVTNVINSYAAGSTGANVNPNLGTVTVSSPTFKCITDSSMVAAPCSASPTGYNVVQVKQTATVPTVLIRLLALPPFHISAAQSLTMSAVSTATMASGMNDQVNVAMVIDSTASMQNNDSDCGHTRIYCALQGVRTMLGYLAPCSAATAKSGATCSPYDQVSVFTFPNVQANTASSDNDCSGSSNPTITPYTTPAAASPNTWTAPTGTTGTYQLTGYLSNWTASNSVGGSLSSSSTLVNTVGGPSGSCNGLQATGGQGTYYAGAIYAAQASLSAMSYANPGSRNVMIILSDGDASASSGHIKSGTSSTNVGNVGNTYPSLDDQCHQGITAAQYATSHGTTVYTIAYGAASSGCSTDKSSLAISPCNALKQMSSGYVSSTNAPRFYSDATASQNKGQCTSQYNLNLQGIFGNIAAQLTRARLIPNNIT